MQPFKFLQPETLEEAVHLLTEHEDEGRLIAGGTALMLAMRQRLVQPACLISLDRIETLRGIDWHPDSGLRIGAFTLHADVASSPLVRAHYPMLADLAQRMANPQVRNQGTLGGNLCYGDPATDLPGGLLALDAEVVLHGVQGQRRLALADFLVDYYTTAIEPDEVLVEVRLPPPGVFSKSRYARFLKTQAEHRPLVSVAINLQFEQGYCRDVRIAIGAATPVPQRARKAEDRLAEEFVSCALIEEVAGIAAAEVDVLDDTRGREWYRRRVIEVQTRRSLASLFEITLGEGGA